MALSTRELAAFVQKVAKLQPQDPSVYNDLKGCSTCIPTLSGYRGLGMGFDSVPWLWVASAAALGAGAMFMATKKGLVTVRKAKKKSRKARKARRNRRRR